MSVMRSQGQTPSKATNRIIISTDGIGHSPPLAFDKIRQPDVTKSVDSYTETLYKDLFIPKKLRIERRGRRVFQFIF